MKKLVSLLLALTVLCAALPLGAVTVSAASVELYGRNLLAQMDHADHHLRIYDRLYEAMSNGDVDLDYRAYCWDCNLELVDEMLYRDCSYYEWHWFFSTEKDGAAAKTAVDSAIEQLTAGLEGKSDYEISLELYKRLAKHVNYRFEGYHQTSYGALVDGVAVCAGYARAYQVLMQSMGIPCWYVTGEAYDEIPDAWVGHAWNLVKLDGEWYYTDPTWGDTDTDNIMRYGYFNTTYAQIATDHRADASCADYLPRSTATANNYFVRNDFVGDGTAVDVEGIAAYLKENGVINLYFESGWREFFTLFGPYLSAIREAMDLPPGEVEEQLLASGNEVIWIIHFTPSAYTAGDANGDGVLSMRDLVTIQKHLNHWDNVIIDLVAADVDGDHEVTLFDLVCIQRYLNGWDVSLW